MNKVKDIKEIVATNLIKYRKANNLTQSQLALKINYSDKAISKWERGEALPDVLILKQIADVYNVDLDDMLHEQTAKEKIQNFYRSRLFISSLSILLVFLVAMIAFVVMNIVLPSFPNYLAFVFAIPVSFIVALVFNSLWGGRVYNMILVSGVTWGTMVSLVLSLENIEAIRNSIHYLYLIAGVFQILIILWYTMDFLSASKKSKKNINNENETI
jgi:transcriptional regulator with XRE-family HTH domain